MVGQRMKPQENVSFRLKNLMPGQKNSEKNICFPWKKLFFLPTVEKTTIFSSGNKSSPQSFSVPGIMFPARRNIYSQLTVFSKVNRDRYNIVDVPGGSCIFFHCLNVNWQLSGIYVPSCCKHYARYRKTLRQTFVS